MRAEIHLEPFVMLPQPEGPNLLGRAAERLLGIDGSGGFGPLPDRPGR